MATFTITTSNWNSASFWSSINPSSGNNTLDFSGLPSNYSLTYDPDAGYLTLTDGTTTFTVGDNGYGGSSDATLGGTTLFTSLNRIRDGQGDDVYEGSAGDDTYAFYDDWGTDTIASSGGFNTVGFYTTTAGVVITATDGSSGTAVSGANTLTWNDISYFEGTDFDDTVDMSSVSYTFTYVANSGDDIVFGSQGDNSIFFGGTTGSLTVTTYGGSDYVEGSANADTFSLGAGDDFAVGLGGDDYIDGESGDDELYGDGGDDTLVGGEGDDTLSGGSGNDTFVLSDGSGGDTITDFDLADDNADGFTNDQLDVSALTDADGNPVNAWDVTVDDDGFGNARLTFPNGEFVVLEGVAPSQINNASSLMSAGVPCFTAGTLIATENGEKRIESLRPGDRVKTRDNGPQEILWIGSRTLDRDALALRPDQRSVHIPEGLLGNHSPLRVSPLHGLLMGLDHGLAQPCLVRAKHLVDAPGPVRIARGCKSVTYFHILCARHEILFANGAPAESFYPGAQSMQALLLPQLLDMCRIIPGFLSRKPLRYYGPPARPFLKRKDALRLELRRPLPVPA